MIKSQFIDHKDFFIDFRFLMMKIREAQRELRIHAAEESRRDVHGLDNTAFPAKIVELRRKK